MHFHIRWPDGRQTRCYSPSLVVRDYFDVGTSYPLAEFLARCRAALAIASARVEAKFGRPCTRALGQLAIIETTACAFADTDDARVTIDAFED
jgi:uncharacterized repeat protein (TIGR04042 family)